MKKSAQTLQAIFISLILNSNALLAQNSINEIYKPSLAPSIPSSELDESVISYFLQFLAANLLYVAGAIAVIFLIIAGAQYATATEDSGAESGKKTIQYVVIGLLAMILSFAAVQIVIQFFFTLPR